VPCQNHRVIEPLQTILIVASLLLAVLAGVYVALDRSPDNALVGLAGLIELGFVAQAGIGIAQVIGDDEVASPVTFVGYLLAALVVLPLGVLWSLAERSRGATAVIIVAAVTTAFLAVRVVQLHG
jgi:hypothetical protein